MCVSVYVNVNWVYLHESLCVSGVILYVCLCVSLYVYVFESVRMNLCVSVCLCVCVFVHLWVSYLLCVFLCLCVCVCPLSTLQPPHGLTESSQLRILRNYPCLSF